MLKRTLSALIGAPIFLGLVYLGGPYTAFLVAVLSLLALLEFLQIGKQIGLVTWPVLTVLVTILWLTSLFTEREEWMLSALLFWFVICLGRLALTYPNASLSEANFNLLAVVYSVVLLSHLYLLRQRPQGIEWTFLTIFLVWATDTGAYLIGRQFGRHLLAPHVSPKKTVEGSIGGLIFSMAVAVVWWRFMGGTSLLTYIILATVIGISGQIGDLFESALKRSAGVKDSGKLIPGHGGILDRFDSLIFALPLVYYGVILLS
ncbi:CDP-diglyceride synthetase [Desulfosporosinus orientis DSM 765]|uniref:Phosphatidate cytidylyltransferase n=1 Tax=Desulfosporosinus orientis (strain ATCC 19365 / DSM 765 / NCIMB 8382 / VKM B-1628 / Singapore I) TaxID=768706 RepID=G7WE70_DESOD|nr:phosphatidate cytidylyltransferase [Desulfosporosinus orientis]AET70046.1 CDP-diglyceride synthetase [Desulfosporosinus orientis DSM 765]